MEIWCVASGKGGVGKSFFSAGTAITLSKLRKKILVIDFDMSGANFHNCVAGHFENKSIADYLYDQKSLTQVIQNSAYQNVDFIYGFCTSHLDHELGLKRAEKLFCDLKKLNYDMIIFDLGPGASKSNLNLMSLADKNFLISNCEPASLEKTYRFVSQMGEEQMILNNVGLILNSTRTKQQNMLGYTITSNLLKKFGLQTHFIGALPYDNAVWQSSLQPHYHMQNVFQFMPYADVCHEFFRICKQFVETADMRAVS